MKRYIFVFAILSAAVFTYAKPIPPKPSFRYDWCDQLPIPENATYVYTRGEGEGATKPEALDRAILQVLNATQDRLGKGVNTREIHDALVSGKEYTVESRTMRIPVNKVCEFYKQDPKTHRWTAYILCQVANSAIEEYEFEPCQVCLNDSIFKARMARYNKAIADSIQEVKNAQKREDGLALVESFFIPGLGQMMKGSAHNKQSWMIEGGSTLAAEVVLFSIGAGTYLGAKKQESISNQWGIDYDTYTSAIKKKKALLGTSYAFFGLAVVAHGVNLYRAYTLRENKNIAFYPAIIPTADQSFAYGLGATIKF